MNQGISQFDEPSGAAQASGESSAGAEDVGMDPRPLVPSTLLAPVQSPSHLLPESGISQELRRVNRALAALRACNQAQARAANEQELLDQICDIFVRLRVRDARHPVAANAHDDVANLVQQLLFIGGYRMRLVARPQRRQCAVHPAKLLADAALGKKMGGGLHWC